MKWYLESINSLYPGYKTFKPTVQLHSESGGLLSFEIDINHEDIRKMTLGEIEELAISKMKCE